MLVLLLCRLAVATEYVVLLDFRLGECCAHRNVGAEMRGRI